MLDPVLQIDYSGTGTAKQFLDSVTSQMACLWPGMQTLQTYISLVKDLVQEDRRDQLARGPTDDRSLRAVASSPVQIASVIGKWLLMLKCAASVPEEGF